MGRVICIEPTTVDIKHAAAFGDITYLFDKENGKMRVSIWDDLFPSQVVRALELIKYDPLADFIIVAGRQVTVTLAIVAAVQRFGAIQVLLFHAGDRAYTARTIGGSTNE